MRIDVSAVTSPQELHTLLAKAFRFLDYYGQNWDAFDECIRDVRLPDTIEISGMDQLRSRLPREAKLLFQGLSSFAEETHDRKTTIHFI